MNFLLFLQFLRGHSPYPWIHLPPRLRQTLHFLPIPVNIQKRLKLDSIIDYSPSNFTSGSSSDPSDSSSDSSFFVRFFFADVLVAVALRFGVFLTFLPS